MEELVKKFMSKIDLKELNKAFDICQDKTQGQGVQCCQTCFKQQFFNGNNISYSCLHKRKLYVVRLLPAHVKEIELALQQVADFFQSEVAGKKLNVCLLGGGPGVESIAVRKFLQCYNIQPSSLLFIRSDIEKTWDEEAEIIVKHFHPAIQKGEVLVDGISYKYGKVCVDLLKTSTLTNVPYFNLFSLSYFLSEVPEDNLNRLANLILSKVEDKSVIIINDREDFANIEKAVTFVKELEKKCTIESISISADKKEFNDSSKEVWFNNQVHTKLCQLSQFEMGDRVSSDIHNTPSYSELCNKLSVFPKSKTQSFRISLVIKK